MAEFAAKNVDLKWPRRQELPQIAGKKKPEENFRFDWVNQGIRIILRA
ncbi:MAG: hypothetical protein HQL07_07380 [Nitrospirae bacterium]|nr:hypothetical protein [Magnetococcales bacterium]